MDQYDRLACAMAKLGWLQPGDLIVERVAALLRRTASTERQRTDSIIEAVQAYLDEPTATSRATLESVVAAMRRRDIPRG